MTFKDWEKTETNENKPITNLIDFPFRNFSRPGELPKFQNRKFSEYGKRNFKGNNPKK